MNKPQPATFVPAETSAFRYLEKSSPQTSNLQFLTYGVYELSGPVRSGLLAHPGEEALLFCWQGETTATLNGAGYPLKHYDVLYVPRGAAYQLGQESRAIFLKGQGAMEVYADEEAKWFVRSVKEGDAVTIPILNYHPVFSQAEELHFIWCIAGNRYWVGDKNKDFMSGKVDKLTT
jgi:mannose-6-phosphate isomerase-like protein (cupin superfamily)